MKTYLFAHQANTGHGTVAQAAISAQSGKEAREAFAKRFSQREITATGTKGSEAGGFEA